VNEFRNVCDDYIGSPGVDHPLAIEKTRDTLMRINGRYTKSINEYYELVNYVPLTTVGVAHLPITFPSMADDFTKLHARTNPNRATVMGTVSIAELRDLPRMVKLAGDSILKNSAGGYLSWTFGWAPLISDVRSLLDFNGAVDRKVNELKRLYSKGGLRRKMKLQESRAASGSNISGGYPGVGGDWTVNMKVQTHKRRWGTIRWKPTSLPPNNNAAMRRKAIQLAFGLDFSASTIWNLLPWTWMIDWFSNVGDYLEANKNTVPVIAGSSCIMEKTETRKVSVLSPNSDAAWKTGTSSGQATRVSMTRTLGSPSITASVPFLTNRQWSILGALAITRLTR
jgi:hypothetical protein